MMRVGTLKSLLDRASREDEVVLQIITDPTGPRQYHLVTRPAGIDQAYFRLELLGRLGHGFGTETQALESIEVFKHGLQTVELKMTP